MPDISVVPNDSTELAREQSFHGLQALLHEVGMVDAASGGWIKVSGNDRVRWLNGMVTNSIQDLSPGAGCYNFVLNAQGRIQGDCYVYAEPDCLLIETARSQVETLQSLLDRFIIMDDVELSSFPDAGDGVLLAGPLSEKLLQGIGISPPPRAAPSLARVGWRSKRLLLVRAYSPLVPRFEIWGDAASMAELRESLAGAEAMVCSEDSFDLLRILEGTPLFGIDIRDRDLPQETSQTRALHFAKGCYLGQEIVERIRSRGNVHRTFHGFTLRGDVATPGAPIILDGKPVGELTSSCLIPGSPEPHQIALGYIRREALAHASSLQYPGGELAPSSLPFPVAKTL